MAKLVRDRIPEIIEADGKEAKIDYLSGDELLKALEEKLVEEVDEYLESGETEELADILEVIYAIGNYKGLDESELNNVREDKKNKRGAFDKGIRLLSVD